MLALGLLSFFFFAVYAQCPAWSFDDSLPNGPSNWGNLCPEYINCKVGQAQSPIDIIFNNEVPGQANQLQKKYQPVSNFVFVNEDWQFEGRNFTVKNTIAFKGIGTKPFTLQDFHFHAPAEHLINGVQYPLEMHFVHADEDGKYVVLVHMFQESTPTSGENNALLSLLAPFIPQILENNAYTFVPHADLFSQFTSDKGFYHYTGSTTIPPCIPNVQFLVATTPISADPKLIALFQSELNNARPLQPLNNRTITLYTAPTTHTTPQWAFALGATGLGVGAVAVGRFLYTKYKRSKGEETDLELNSLLVK